MNSLCLRAVLAELTPFLGLRLREIAAPDPWTLHLKFERDTTLVVSVSPARPALFVAPAGAVTAEGSTPFSKALTEALGGGRLAAWAQAGLDRVAALAIEKRDRLGDATRRHLVAEFTGAGSNLVLVDGPDPWTGRILDRLREDRSRSSSRRLSPGRPYAVPDPAGVDASRASAEELAKAYEAARGEGLSAVRAVTAAWAGTGPGVSEEIVRRAEGESPSAIAASWLRLLQETSPASDGCLTPRLT